MAAAPRWRGSRRDASASMAGFALTTTAVLLAVGALAGCSDRIEPGVLAATTVREVTTTTTAAPPTSVVPSLLPPVNVERSTAEDPRDWSGQRYELGRLEDVRLDAGDRWLTFVPQGLRSADGAVRTGDDFDREPIVVGDTTVQIVDRDAEPADFSVAPDVVVLRLGDDWTCAPDGPPLPTWDELDYEALAIFGPRGADVVSLVFDGTGQVVQIRLARAC